MKQINDVVAPVETAGAGKSIVAAAGLLIALLLTIGCSKEKSKPEVASSSLSTAPSQTMVPPSAPVLNAVPPVAQKPVVKKAARKHASMVTYKDDTNGISFGYPRKYSLKTGEDLKSDADASVLNFAQTGGIATVSVELPNNAYPGTDLTSAFFQVNVHKGLGEAECAQFALPQPKPDDKNAVQPSDVELNGMHFHEVENISGESTKQVDTKYYHLFEGGSCYEFALGLTTAWDGNEDGVNLVDREDVFHRLEKILAGVKINQEAAPATPAVASTDRTAQPASGDALATPATPVASMPQPEPIKK